MYDIAGQHNRYFDQPVSWLVATIPYLYSVFFIFFFFFFVFSFVGRKGIPGRKEGGQGQVRFKF